MDTVSIKQVVAKDVTPKAPAVTVPLAEVPAKSVSTAPSINKALTAAKEPDDFLSADGRVKQTVSELNSFVQNIQRGIQFSVHEETGRSVVVITDKNTGEEIRKFPSDQLLAMAEHISETLAVPEELGLGLLVNGKA